MAEAVERALATGRHLAVEAGTGVGKSFAYLVPAIAWAAATKRRVAVATSTIALQEQLVTRDLPLLARALPFPVAFALVKGRGNYVCRRRLHAALSSESELFPTGEVRDDLVRIRDAVEAGAASRQDLPLAPREDAWEAARAEAGNCLHRECPHFARCGYQDARRRAHEASLLVLNHHALLADLALRRSGASFLPEVHAVVVDEAHDLEDTAAEILGARLTSLGVQQVLGRLWNPRRRSGLLARTGDDRLRARVEDAREASRRWFEEARAGLPPPDAAGLVPVEGPLAVGDALPHALSALATELSSRVAEASTRDAALELAARARSLGDLADLAGDAAEGPSGDEVEWAEWDARGNGVVVRAPVDVGPALRAALHGAFPTVVLTSATLCTGRPPSFAFVRRRLGLDAADELCLGSPFDFARRARVVVRADLPDPSREAAAYEAALPAAVLSAVRASRGGAFVLFTSVESMRRCADAVRGPLEADGVPVLVQGEDLSRTAMLERFRARDSALFGVASFWQGVDVPGDALRHVVIARLPFDVPTHPLQRARAAREEREGRRAFETLSLPAAALRLKQGFGRLLRRATDRGVVTILDSRVATRPYGRSLLESLPECPVEVVAGGDGDPAAAAAGAGEAYPP
jgi:ATP-dependent DNA helicase DinG